jgi:hypothetical protein
MRSAPDLDPAVFYGSTILRSYADAWYDGESTAEDLPIVGGSIDGDSDADVRHTLTVTVADPDGRLVPRAATDPLAVFGQELKVSMSVLGLGYADATPTGLGWFRIQVARPKERWMRSAGVWRHGGATIELECLDRMQILADYRFIVAEQPPAGATVVSEIRRLVEDLVPIGEIDGALTDAPVPAGTVYQDDRVSALQALARSIGGNLIVDSEGSLRLVRPTQYGAIPVWTFQVGEGGDIVDYATELTRDGVINAVVATGDADTDHAPVQGIAYDTDPASPTRWGGPFGRVPLGYSSPLLTTPGQAGQAAATRLANYRRGREREIPITCPPNYLLELDDPVAVVLPDRTMQGRIVRLSLPLRPGRMSVTVRALDTSTIEVAT